MSFSGLNTRKPLKEKGANEFEPSIVNIFLKIEVLEYAKYLTINLLYEGYLIELLIVGMKAKLPQHWQACQAQDEELIH